LNLRGLNVKYYEELGYHTPRIINDKDKFIVDKNTSIKIKIKDLKHGLESKIKI